MYPYFFACLGKLSDVSFLLTMKLKHGFDGLIMRFPCSLKSDLEETSRLLRLPGYTVRMSEVENSILILIPDLEEYKLKPNFKLVSFSGCCFSFLYCPVLNCPLQSSCLL